MYGFEGVGLSEVQLLISELSVVGGWWVGGWVEHKRTSWSDLVGVRQILATCVLERSTGPALHMRGEREGEEGEAV